MADNNRLGIQIRAEVLSGSGEENRFAKQLQAMVDRIPDSKLPKITVQIDPVKTKQVFQKQLNDIMKSLSLDTSKLSKESASGNSDGKNNNEEATGKKIISLATQRLNLLSQTIAFRKKNNNLLLDEKNVLDSIYSKTKSAKSTDDVKEQVVEFKKVKLAAQEAGRVGESSLQHLGTMFQKFSTWFGITQIIMTAVDSIKKMVSNVVELDSSLVELQKVSNLTGNSLQLFTNKAFDSASEIGRTGKELIDATSEWKRAGYSLESSFELGKASLVLTNVADGIDSVSEASSALIAVLRGFNMSDASVMGVVDALNEVSNTSPIGFQDLTEGLRRVSGTLAQTGTTLEQTVGLLTGGFASLRDIESVSSGLNMISARLRGVDEDGQAIAGLAPKLQKAFKDIANIDVADANGELRSTYDILSDMARVFPTLNSQQRQYLGELAAGNRQVKVLTAILNGWNDVEGAVSSALNSQGSALIENEKVLNSIQGKINLFVSEFQKLSQNTIDSNLIKSIVDLGTGLIKLVGILGGIPNLLLAIAGAIVAIKLPLLAATFSKLVVTVGQVVGAFIAARLSGTSFAASLNAVGVAATTAQLAVGSIVIALTAAIAVFSLVKNSIEEARRKAEEANTAIINQANSVSELIARYKELAQSGDFDNAKREEAKSIQDQIKNLVGAEAENLDLVNGKLDDKIKKLREIEVQNLKNKENALISEYNLATEDAKNTNDIGYNNNVSNTWNDMFNGGNNTKAVQAISALDNPFLNIVDDGRQIQVLGTLEEKIKTVNEALEILKINGLQNTNIFTQLQTSQQNYAAILERIKNATNDINSNSAGIQGVEGLLSIANSEIPKTKEEFDSFINSVVDGLQSAESSTGEYGYQFRGTNEEIKQSILDFLSTQPEFVQFFNSASDSVSGYTDIVSMLTNALNTISNETSILSQAFKELRDDQRLSSDTLTKLLEQYPELLNSLKTENGIVSINKKLLEEKFQASIKGQIAELENTKSSAQQELNIIEQKIAALKKLIQAYALVGAWANVAYASKELGDLNNSYSGFQKTVDELQIEIDVLNAKSLGGLTASIDSATSATNKLKNAMSSAQSAINTLLSMTIDMLKQQYKEAEEAQSESIQQQIDNLKDLEEAEKKAAKEDYERARAKIQNQLDILKAKKDTYNYEKELLKKQQSATAIQKELDELQNDNSEEAQKRKRQLAEQLAEAKDSIDETQYNRGIQLQEDALNSELDRIKAIYDARLASIEDSYDYERQRLEEQLSQIKDNAMTEAQIRQEAIALIQGKSEEFYNQLMAWNLQYGDGLTSTVQIAWGNAYKALEEFGNGQINVLDTLNSLALRMNDFATSTQDAANSMRDLTNAINDKNDAESLSERFSYTNPNILSTIGSYANGGVITSTGKADVHGTKNSPEVVFNAEQSKKLYDYVVNTKNLSDNLISRIAGGLNSKTLPNINNVNNSPSISIPITIQGNASKDTVKSIEKAVTDGANMVWREFNKHIQLGY